MTQWQFSFYVQGGDLSPEATYVAKKAIQDGIDNRLTLSLIKENASKAALEFGAKTLDGEPLSPNGESMDVQIFYEDNAEFEWPVLDLPMPNYGCEPEQCPYCNAKTGELRQFTEYNYTKDIYDGKESPCGARWIANRAKQPDGDWEIIYWTPRRPCGNPSAKSMINAIVGAFGKDAVIEMINKEWM